jgi:beta-glucosidase
VARGTPFTCRGGIRLGAIRKVDDEEAIQHAATLAKEADGMPEGL